MRLSFNSIKDDDGNIASNESAWILNLYSDLKMLAKLGVKTEIKLEPWMLEAFFYIEEKSLELEAKQNGKR